MSVPITAKVGPRAAPARFTTSEEAVRAYVWPPLVSVALTAVMITINHLFVLGARAFALGALLVGVAAPLLWWFTKTRNRAALAGYLLLNLWIVAGFGLFKGLWKGALRLFLGTLLSSISTSFPKPTMGSPLFEMSGIGI